ncbi:hypothetical protein [Runella sp.]|jgi:hypothetical protein|uniref:hypothetical protein n=1 Tax=Runella sp. TaxID=1960881 RepID=UPI00263356B7|nr:hypothetical protein [Runella sp.]
MQATLKVRLSVKKLAELARQLSPKEKSKLIALLQEEEEEYMTKEELVERIKEGLEEVKLYKEGKIKLRTLKEFLADV